MATLMIARIVATPGTCGGKPRIDGTRMKVEDVAMYHAGGMTVEEIVEDFELTPAQVHTALAYYYDHQEEIERDIAEGEAYMQQLIAEGKVQLDTKNRDEIVRRMREIQQQSKK